jgi:hypothetical protein
MANDETFISKIPRMAKPLRLSKIEILSDCRTGALRGAVDPDDIS